MATMNIELNNTTPVTIEQNDTRLQLDINNQEEINNRFGPSTNAVINVASSPSSPEQVVNDIIESMTKRKRNWMIRTFLVALALILLSVGCFMWSNTGSNETKATPLIFAIFLTIAGVIIFFVSWGFCCSYCCCPSNMSYELHENFESAIRLDGITWEDQVDAIQGAILPQGFIGCCGTAKRFDRLKIRQYGHIVFAKAGIIIDDLLSLPYERCIVTGINCFTNNRTQTGFVLQLHIQLRYYTVTNYNTNPITKFDMNLFMPPQMTLEDVEVIAYRIRANSYTRLAALRFVN